MDLRPKDWKEVKGPFLRAPVICGCGAKDDGFPAHALHIDCQCNGQLRHNKGFLAPRHPEFNFPRNTYDLTGYPLCQWCGKLLRGQISWSLFKCPTCKKWFKAPKPFMKRLIEYECKECR